MSSKAIMLLGVVMLGALVLVAGCEQPAAQPTVAPQAPPTVASEPTAAPTTEPATNEPTAAPTTEPATNEPTASPTEAPSVVSGDAPLAETPVASGDVSVASGTASRAGGPLTAQVAETGGLLGLGLVLGVLAVPARPSRRRRDRS